MDTQETKIRKGQAFNLAVNDAVHNNVADSPKYIYKRFVYYYTLAEVVQGSDIDMIQEVINNKDFDLIINKIKAVMEKT